MLNILLAPGRVIFTIFSWIGLRYYFGIALALHIIVISLIYWIVIAEPRIEEEKILKFSIVTSLEEFLTDNNDDTLEGGKNALTDLKDFTPGKEKEKTAKEDKAKMATSKKMVPIKEVGTSGRATISPIESGALGNLLDGNAFTSGDDSKGGGDVPSGYGLRGKGKRGQGLAEYGGGKKTEDAVALGLLWLRNHLHLDEYKDKNAVSYTHLTLPTN